MHTKIVIDLDGTLTLHDSASSYAEKMPNVAVVAKLREYAADGYVIVIHTARNMRTYDGEVGLINVHTLPVIVGWLDHHDIPYHEIIVGKPWCGPGGFYVDDRSLRPDEFARMSREEVSRLIGDEAPQ